MLRKILLRNPTIEREDYFIMITGMIYKWQFLGVTTWCILQVGYTV